MAALAIAASAETEILATEESNIVTETESAEPRPHHEREAVVYDRDNGVVPIADDRGFTLQSRDGKFIFKPYLFMQTSLNFNYYDDEGLDKAYNQDNVANSGFAVPSAILGFTGKLFGKVDYNLSINAAASGGAILQQAWIDYKANDALRFRVGKFKTPFSHAYLTTLGETLFPSLPQSLTAQVILPYSLNAVCPSFATYVRQETGPTTDTLRPLARYLAQFSPS